MRDPHVMLMIGNAVDRLRYLPDCCVQTCVTSPPYYALRSYLDKDDPLKKYELGTEPAPALYIASLVAVFREIRRVLRDDGTCWIVISDSFGRNPAKGQHKKGSTGKQAYVYDDGGGKAAAAFVGDGIKEKDLCMIPATLAIALRTDGWYLRSRIIWAKDSCLPESVKDRPSSSYEEVLMLTKTDKYVYDYVGVQESEQCGRMRGPALHPGLVSTNGNGGLSRRESIGVRRLRNVWRINPEPIKDAHFAAFPTRLASTCIVAGAPEGGACSKCDTPLRRVIEDRGPDVEHAAACGADNSGGYDGESQKDYADAKAQDASTTKARILAGMRKRVTTGWVPTCNCRNAEVVPCTVLDPFSGAGSTALAAIRSGRDAVGIDLKSEYVNEIALPRLLNPASKCLNQKGERIPYREFTWSIG